MISFKEMAIHLKNNIVCKFPDDYVIAEELKQEFSDADICAGLKSFSGLLSQLFDVFIQNSDYLSCFEKGTSSKWKGHTNIYTNLRSPLAMLYAAGLCGRYDINSDCLYIDGSGLNKEYRKTLSNKPEQCLQVLNDSGLVFSVDITAKSFNLNKAGMFEIHFPDEKLALLGLKVMAEAVNRISGAKVSKTNIIYIFARCDYNALALPKKFSFKMNEVTNFLPDEYKKFFISLHDYLLVNNCKYESSNQVNEYVFSYTSKTKKSKVISICIAIDHSYIKLNSKLISIQPDLLSDAPESIKNAVRNGIGCAKEHNPDACNPKCAGKNLRFTLDGIEYLKCWILNFNLPIVTNVERECIKEWLEKELA